MGVCSYSNLKMISLTLLVENTARGTGLTGEHGLSYWLDTGSHQLLFDTGQGKALFHNARRLGFHLRNLDAIVLSHGHHDHVGGLEEALTQAPKASLYLHPDAILPKFTGLNPTDGISRRNSTMFMEAEAFRVPGRNVIVSRKPCEVIPGVWMTGEIPRTNSFENTGGSFYMDKMLQQPDPLLDDQSLYLRTAAGLVVILGCAHSGVVNTLHYIRELTGENRIHTLIGGTHLESASPERMDQTVVALKEFSPQRLGFCHCTGLAATVRFWNEFPGKCFPVHAGLHLEFEE
jgi:7,8-dihydropterin-6-yl-methyl-4-(beta-D-ribofuranosyl)aminobenzene 5'-phosphate synthase